MLRSVLDTIAGSVDRAVLRAQHGGVADDPTIRAMTPAQRLVRLRELAALYGDPALLRFPGGFLDDAPPIAPELRAVARNAWDARWPSAYVPWNPEIAEPYLAHVGNLTAHARLFLAEAPGPTVVLVHGYGAGHFGVEERLWPVRALLRRGWSVVLTTLPFHGRRALPGRALTPPFPGADPRLVNEGFRQAIHDLLGLHAWLRARGHGPVGVWGMSLGAYTAALFATLEPSLAFAGLVIPLGSLADYARLHGRLGEGDEAGELHAALEHVNAVISPYARPSVLPPERVRILAARSDRITGLVQAERLGRHFGVAPTVCAGSHILQVGVPGGFAELVRWVEGVG
jgi:dienelactone hydrolase